MRNTLRTLSLSILVLCSVSAAANAAEFDNSQRQEIETIVRDYLLNHPEILQEAAQTLEQKQKQAEDEQRKDGLAKNADQIFRSKPILLPEIQRATSPWLNFLITTAPGAKRIFPTSWNLSTRIRN